MSSGARGADWAARQSSCSGWPCGSGSRATPPLVRSLEPDAVVIAAGSAPAPAGLVGDAVVDIDTFLLGTEGAGRRVVLVDRGAAGMPLWSAALEASRRGAWEVTIVTPVPVVAGDVDGATFLALYGELSARGVRFATDCVATALRDGHLDVANVYGGVAAPVAADLVVVSTARVACGGDLAGSLADLGPIVVGDALAPRDAAAAIREGASAGEVLAVGVRGTAVRTSTQVRASTQGGVSA